LLVVVAAAEVEIVVQMAVEALEVSGLVLPFLLLAVAFMT
jgi:hypothetical protein